MPQDFLPHHGGYKKLRVYKVTEIIYDMTYYFVHHFLEKGDRTIDQMEQAARSGKQNIVEGSMASVTSRETEIKLTNVAKSSLEELLVDYKDFLRVRNLPEWDAVHPRFQRMRDYVQSSNFAEGYQVMMTRLNSEEFANLCITLINQATYMLRRLMESQQKQFLVEGGIREEPSDKSDKSDRSDRSDRSDESDKSDRQEGVCCPLDPALFAAFGSKGSTQSWCERRI